MKKRWPRTEDFSRFRFETPLPADLAMERLHALSTHQAYYFKAYETYRVSSKRQDDSIYFEIKVRASYNWWPALLRRIINGQIREIDPTRTLVEGEVHTPWRARAPVAVLLILLYGGILVSLSTGDLSLEDIAKQIGLAIICTAAFMINEFWRVTPHSSVQSVEKFIRPRTEDQNLMARRKARHLSHRHSEIGLPAALDSAEFDGDIQDSA